MTSPKHHILILGATGACGIILTHALLESGYQLTLYVRTPSKLPEEVVSNAKVTIIQGELNDTEGLKKAAASGADVFISVAGPTLGKREKVKMPITTALRVLYQLLLEAGTFKHILTLSTPSFPAPEDKFSLKWFIAVNGYIRLFHMDAYEEIRGIAQATVDLGDKVEWTVFRVPLLEGKTLNENKGDVASCYIGDAQGKDGLHLDRGRLVKWILAEMDEKKWVGHLPAISNV
ncbi:hypothetical protein K3495_g11910 [Podosphaera aphanis]|nr:hypothetical protein K3495_g11910 [Podosphaera aphanis]